MSNALPYGAFLITPRILNDERCWRLSDCWGEDIGCRRFCALYHEESVGCGGLLSWARRDPWTCVLRHLFQSGPGLIQSLSSTWHLPNLPTSKRMNDRILSYPTLTLWFALTDNRSIGKAVAVSQLSSFWLGPKSLRFTELHGFEKPNDLAALELMDEAAKAVLKAYPGDVVLAFGESDEYRCGILYLLWIRASLKTIRTNTAFCFEELAHSSIVVRGLWKNTWHARVTVAQTP